MVAELGQLQQGITRADLVLLELLHQLRRGLLYHLVQQDETDPREQLTAEPHVMRACMSAGASKTKGSNPEFSNGLLA